ncbi:MAG: glucoamylase family protein [Bacteroidales bacterium]|nr:glucoamylase family protein [Bacteroidales bacterium]
MNLPIWGWNECLITYIITASSPYHAISKDVYDGSLTGSSGFKKRQIILWHPSSTRQLRWGRPAFLRALYVHKRLKSYGENCRGLTAGDSYRGYAAHCPEVDFGVIQPTEALSSFPFTPEFSMQALLHFYYDLGDHIWSEYGFVDGFSEAQNWYAKSHLAIDQGPIVVMIQNYRSGLLWKLFMQDPEIQNGLRKLEDEAVYGSDCRRYPDPEWYQFSDFRF